MFPESCGTRVFLCRDCVCLASACRVAARFWSPGEVPGAASLCRSPALSERGGPASSCAVCSTAVQRRQQGEHERGASAARFCQGDGNTVQALHGCSASSCAVCSTAVQGQQQSAARAARSALIQCPATSQMSRGVSAAACSAVASSTETDLPFDQRQRQNREP